MHLDTMNRIKNNPNSTKFLKENSNWYKYLNRDRQFIKAFEEQVRVTYKLTAKDRIEKLSNNLDMVSKVMDIFN